MALLPIIAPAPKSALGDASAGPEEADGAAIECQFEGRGFDRAVTAGDAELVVLNTCTVTAAADRDARAAVRRIHRQNPKAQIIVTGCYAQRAPGEVASLR